MILGLVLALLSAVAHSIGDIIVKKKVETVDPDILAFGWFGFGVPFLLATTAIYGVPQIKQDFMLALFVSGSLNILAIMLYIRALQASSISKTIPMLSFTPAFLLITSPLILNEFPSATGVVGIAMIIGGTYMLNFDRLNPKILGPFLALAKDRGPAMMLVVAAIFSVAINFDKIGVVNSSPSFYALSVFSFIGTGLLVIMLIKKREELFKIKDNLRILIPLGASEFAMALLALTALSLTIAPYVIAIKRTNILFSSLIGFSLFKETQVKQRLVAIFTMIAGVFVIFLFP